MGISKQIDDAVGRIRSKDDAAQVVKRAVEAERERCAKIAEKVARNNERGGNDVSFACFIVASEIASYIRKGRS